MPIIVMTKPARSLDGSIKSKVMSFLEKLGENDQTSGLHIEPIHGAPDARVRTGRVDKFWRAVLFKLEVEDERYYVVHGVFPHDEAAEVAQKVFLKVNPVNGLTQIVPVEPTTPPPPPPVKPGSGDADPEPEFLPLAHRDRSDLVGVLGIPDEVADLALAASEDELQALVMANDGWVGNMLLDLLGNDTIAEIADRHSVSTPTGTSTDEDVLISLRKPGAQSQFAFIEGQDELRRVIESGDVGAWRTFLHPEQRKYATKNYNGPFRLSGGAGTGKTVVLIHRARYLVGHNPDARILLTTFTSNLAEALSVGLASLDPAIRRASKLGQVGVFTSSVDALASSVIRTAGPAIDSAVNAVLGHSRSAPNSRTPGDRWASVIDAGNSALPTEIANRVFMEAEYQSVVLPLGVTTEEQYLKARRTGRGQSLNRAQRKLVWELVAAYRTQNSLDGTLDYAEAAAVAARHLESTGPVADHILVDEGQDLSPLQWQMLRAAVAEQQDDLFIAEDSHQRIYGQKVVLGRYGIRIVGRSQRLRLNYRTTAQNLQYALSVLEGGDYLDLEEAPETADYKSARTGPQPIVLAVDSLSDELKEVVRVVKEWQAAEGNLGDIAVLVPDRYQRQRVVQTLTGASVPAREIDRDQPFTDRVNVLTMHRAKGTEFPKIVVVDVGFVSDTEKGRLADLHETDRSDAELRTRSLLYVAATRARDELVLITR